MVAFGLVARTNDHRETMPYEPFEDMDGVGAPVSADAYEAKVPRDE